MTAEVVISFPALAGISNKGTVPKGCPKMILALGMFWGGGGGGDSRECWKNWFRLQGGCTLHP